MRAILLASCLLMGCLVTEKKEFPPEPNCPPSVETATVEGGANFPLEHVIKLDLSTEPSGDAGPIDPSLEFNFDIRDCNESQELRFRVFSSIRTAFLRERTVRPPQRNPASFTLDRSDFPASLAGTCQSVEVLVTGAWEDASDDREPATPGDIGTGTWWIAITNTENPSVEMGLCP
jgi:hypothetical protein